MADDDARIRTLVARLITRLQGHPLAVADGAAAVAAVQTHGALLCGAVLDVVMPHTSGIGVAAAIQQHGLSIPIVLMSGAIPAQLEQPLRTLRAITVLPKPFELTDLRTHLQVMLHQTTDR